MSDTTTPDDGREALGLEVGPSDFNVFRPWYDQLVPVVELDVSRSLARYFTPHTADDGFRLIDTFGDDGALIGLTGSDDRRVFLVARWLWGGRHSAAIPARFGEAAISRATGNPVKVNGVSIVETIRRPNQGQHPDPPFLGRPGLLSEPAPQGVPELPALGKAYIRRYVDWLSVYAQLGVVFSGRPVGMTGTELREFNLSPEPAPQA